MPAAFVFVPSRTASTRLPAKALLPLGGKSALQHLLERLRLSRRTGGVVLCTTTSPADDPLIEIAEQAGTRWFRGSEEDLLDRFLGAATAFGVELIVNVDGDDILVDPEQVDELVVEYERTGADFLTYEGLPFGAAPVGVRVAALQQVCQEKTETDTATGWRRFFERPGRFNMALVQVSDPDLRHPEYRLTLDYPEDYHLLQVIWTTLDRSQPLRLREVLRFLRAHPEVAATNANLEERYWTHFESHLPPSLRRPGHQR